MLEYDQTEGIKYWGMRLLLPHKPVNELTVDGLFIIPFSALAK